MGIGGRMSSRLRRLTHFGLEATNADSVIEHRKAVDVSTEDSNLSSYTRAKVARVVSPSGTLFRGS